MYLKRIVCVGLYITVSFKVDACETKRNKPKIKLKKVTLLINSSPNV